MDFVIPISNGQDTFYVINPMVRPIPAGMSVLCLETEISNNKSFLNNISSYEILYDLYSSKDCLKFIAWMVPTPNTTPLYIYRNNNHFTATLHKKPHIHHDRIIYVMTNKQDGHYQIKGIDNDNGISFPFMFGSIDGRIIPRTVGLPLFKFLPLHEKNLENPFGKRKKPSILSLLDIEKGNKDNESGIFKVMFLVLLFILLVIILTSMGFSIYYNRVAK